MLYRPKLIGEDREYTHLESNQDLRLRRPLHYPLCYGCKTQISLLFTYQRTNRNFSLLMFLLIPQTKNVLQHFFLFFLFFFEKQKNSKKTLKIKQNYHYCYDNYTIDLLYLQVLLPVKNFFLHIFHQENCHIFFVDYVILYSKQQP